MSLPSIAASVRGSARTGVGSALPAKLTATLAAVGATAGIAGLGTYATFDSTTSADLPTTSGVVSLALGTAGADNRLTVTASGLVPGDTVQRAFNLVGTSTDAAATVAMTTTAPVTSSLLDTNATHGLQMLLDHCSVAWVESGPPYTYSCPGTTTTVVTSRAVLQSALDLKAMATAAGLTLASAATGTDRFRVTLTLPTTADNTYQNLASTVRFSFTATQRAAASR